MVSQRVGVDGWIVNSVRPGDLTASGFAEVVSLVYEGRERKKKVGDQGRAREASLTRRLRVAAAKGGPVKPQWAQPGTGFPREGRKVWRLIIVVWYSRAPNARWALRGRIDKQTVDGMENGDQD